MIKNAIPIAVENRQETLILGGAPYRGGTDGRYRAASPSHIGLVVLSPTRVRRRAFDVLHGQVSDERPGMIECTPNKEVLDLTALSSKALL